MFRPGTCGPSTRDDLRIVRKGLCELRPQVDASLRKLGVLEKVQVAASYDEAVTVAAENG